jgi:hypothetical protein
MTQKDGRKVGHGVYDTILYIWLGAEPQLLFHHYERINGYEDGVQYHFLGIGSLPLVPVVCFIHHQHIIEVFGRWNLHAGLGYC